MYKPQYWREGEIVCIDESQCKSYRYSLEVRWGKSGHIIAVVGLNPSTASWELDDKTIRQCIDWARGEDGCVGLRMLNAFPFRHKKPKYMKDAEDPFGGQTPDRVVEMCGHGRVVAAWGNDAKHLGRGVALAAAFSEAAVQLECWDVNVTGMPEHPGRIGIGKTKPWPRKSATTA